MAFQVKTLPLVVGLAISCITVYFFMKKQKKSRQSYDTVSPKKFENVDIEAALQASNADSECPTEQEMAVSYAQETQAENVPFKKCEEIIENKPDFLEATVGIDLEEGLKYQDNILVEEIIIYYNDFQQVSLFCSDAEQAQKAVSQAQETQAENVSFKHCDEAIDVKLHFIEDTVETALEESLKHPSNIEIEEITISQEKISLAPTLQPKEPQEMSSLSRLNLKFWLLLAIYFILVIYYTIFF